MNLQQLADAVAALEARVAALEGAAKPKPADDQPPHKTSADATGQSGDDDQPPHKP